jgi:hypothetical protein
MKCDQILAFDFPKLRNMSLYLCHFEGEGPRFNLPSLRHLHYSPHIGLPSLGERRLLEEVSKALYSLTCDVETASWLPPSIISSPLIKICYSVELYQSAQVTADTPFIKCLRIQCYSLSSTNSDDDEEEEYEFEEIDLWTDFVKNANAPTTLILAYIDVEPNIPPGFQIKIAKLLQLCQKRGIRVIRENQSHSQNFSENVSPWFIQTSEICQEGLSR